MWPHFKDLLGKTLAPGARDHEMSDHVIESIDAFQTELDQPFTHDEIRRSLTSLKNNKASSFDLVCNEMLKYSGSAMERAISVCNLELQCIGILPKLSRMPVRLLPLMGS